MKIELITLFVETNRGRKYSLKFRPSSSGYYQSVRGPVPAKLSPSSIAKLKRLEEDYKILFDVPDNVRDQIEKSTGKKNPQ